MYVCMKHGFKCNTISQVRSFITCNTMSFLAKYFGKNGHEVNNLRANTELQTLIKKVPYMNTSKTDLQGYLNVNGHVYSNK